MKSKKICLVLSLIAVFLFTGLIGGPGLSFANDEPDWEQIIMDIADLQESLGKLNSEQMENAVNLWKEAVNSLWGQDGHEAILSEGQQTCLEITLGLNYSNNLAPVYNLRTYINNNTSNSLTGYDGFINALQTNNLSYLIPLCYSIYNAYGTPVINKLDEHDITIDGLAGIIADLANVKFAPGIEFTPEVSAQFQDILNGIVVQSNLTNDNLNCCGLTGSNFEKLLGRLKEYDAEGLEDILRTMGNIESEPSNIVVPIVQTNDATDITTTSATLNGKITDTGGENCTVCKFVYRLQGAVDWTNAGEEHGSFGTGDFSFTLTGLTQNTTYEFKAMAYNSAGWGEGSLVHFTTAATPPQEAYILVVETNKTSYIKGEQVNLTGTLKQQNDQEQTPVKNVSIGLQLVKGTPVAFKQVTTDANGVFNWQIQTGWLTAGSYTVFATANVANAQTEFAITEAVVVVPTVQTVNATDITTTSATLNGNITNTGGENCTVRKFVYRLQGAVDWTNAGEEHGSFGTGDFSFALTGLTQNTTYEFKAMAYNSAGWGEGLPLTCLTSRTTTGGGGGGGGGGSTCELNVDTYLPAVNAENVAIDTVVKVTFKQNIEAVDLTKVSVKDAQNNIVSGVTATVDGKVLTIAHDNFAYNTKYTVSVPYGTVKRSDCTANNSSLSWSFTTAKETIPTPPCVYSDVQDSYWAAGVIKELCEKGILDGYPDGTFRPRNDITRAEFAKIMVVALGLAEENTATPTFKDVAPGDWYYGVVEAASKAGLVEGYGKGLFKPNAKITREEITAILVRALGKQDEAAAKANTMTSFKDNHDISSWARGSVVVAFNEGLIKGYPNGAFGPKKNAIRAEVCAMVSRMLAKL